MGRYRAGRDGWIELRSCVCGATMTVEDQNTKPTGDSAGLGDVEPTERPAAS